VYRPTELAKGVNDKCLSKMTWYHCAAAVRYPPFCLIMILLPAVLSIAVDVKHIRQDLHTFIAAIIIDISNQRRNLEVFSYVQIQRIKQMLKKMMRTEMPILQ